MEVGIGAVMNGRSGLGEIEALARAGRAVEAAAAVSALRAARGSFPALERIDARLRRAAGDVEGAIDSLRRAAMLETSADRLAELAAGKADLLGSLARRREAAAVLAGVGVRHRPGSWLRAMRGTVEDAETLAHFEAAVHPVLAFGGTAAAGALYHLSMAYRDTGAHDLAYHAARARILRLADCRPPGYRRRRAAATGWRDEAAVALADLQDDLGRHGIRFFLISGVLLGCIRENDILGHDKDIDVGVEEDVSFERLRAALESSPRFLVKPVRTEHAVFARHLNGVDVDVFRHVTTDGRTYHQGVKVRWWNTPFDLTPRTFLGREHLIPSDPERYLDENYGDWRTPVREWETFVDTPNMEVTDRDQMVWYLANRLSDYYALGKRVAFGKIVRALAALRPPDEPLAAFCASVVEGGERPLDRLRRTRPVLFATDALRYVRAARYAIL